VDPVVVRESSEKLKLMVLRLKNIVNVLYVMEMDILMLNLPRLQGLIKDQEVPMIQLKQDLEQIELL